LEKLEQLKSSCRMWQLDTSLYWCWWAVFDNK